MSNDDFLSAMDDLGATDYIAQLRNNYVKAPFGWPGGKSKSLEQLMSYIPVRRKYIEVCGGSGALLLARPESELEVFNDRHSGITDFFRVIKSPVMLEKFIEQMPEIHSREMWIRANREWTESEDPVIRAALWYYMIIMSFSTQGRCFGRATNPPSMMARKLAKRIPLIQEVSMRIRNVQIENQDMLQLMRDYDSRDAVFYIDPPYVGKNIYQHNISREDHKKMCNIAMSMKGFVAISGYENDIYGDFQWTDIVSWEVMRSITPQASNEENEMAGSEHKQDRGNVKEYLWIKEAE